MRLSLGNCLKRSHTWLSPAFLALSGLTLFAPQGHAQPTYPACQPPLPDEYLVLVPTANLTVQEEIRRLIPGAIETTVCNYVNETVTRLGGFGRADQAQEWAEYVNSQAQIVAYVVRPAGVAATPSSPPVLSSPGAYNPQPLGNGYAVLVDFFSNPQVAAELWQILRTDIGLVSYGQRPYLLATSTREQNRANELLQTLSDRGFFATIVDSGNVILLDSTVQLD
ncbi:hypothetical protein [Laspinema olomoucense]|uniref:hypothetical protein n=1 Tax=Laspinema olomoucense TaxID=3231600 RepID=UPI0021BB74E5|nr:MULTISPECIES: hypothetical protein [unclassified Laspinema]MCT7987358.1 hypothetical protein [Laspinema sp. D3a]MCT7992079.1 hypothetical protein [Laspinema sp. D3c]